MLTTATTTANINCICRIDFCSEVGQINEAQQFLLLFPLKFSDIPDSVPCASDFWKRNNRIFHINAPIQLVFCLWGKSHWFWWSSLSDKHASDYCFILISSVWFSYNFVCEKCLSFKEPQGSSNDGGTLHQNLIYFSPSKGKRTVQKETHHPRLTFKH